MRVQAQKCCRVTKAPQTARTAAAADWTLLPDDITREIFARPRPSEPLYLFRVSHLCKDWLRALTDPDFLRLLHDRCVTPLLLGFLHGLDEDLFLRSHGRALFLLTKVRGHGGFNLLMWDPISGDRHLVPVPPEASRGHYPGAALVCALPGCNGCHFQVAFVANPPDCDDQDDEQMVNEAFMYSSETELWIKLNPSPDWSEAWSESFGPDCVQHDLPNTTVDDGDKGIEGEGKALELAQQLFNSGSNSIERMDFVNAVHCLSQSLDIRVGHYGKLATECATTYYIYGCALLYKARQSTDCIANVHKETATDESVKNKEYDENSNASGTNAEDAPSLEKVKSNEGRKSNEKM
ncbi:unnamed protein product [Alopecurus aequalis]